MTCEVLGNIELHLGDCIEVMKTLPDNSVDSIVTDPPYHLTSLSRGGHARTNNPEMPHGRHRIGDKGFMGKVWDGGDIAHRVEMWTEALRVLKPGGHMLAFSGSRTYHRMTCAIEDAGFEIRDQIMWIYGSGFPKSRNGEWGGTALKPAHEPICMARKPLIGTVERNWKEHGTGAINIDACRVLAEKMPPNTGKGALPRRYDGDDRDGSPCGQPHELGRWPANVIHDGSDEVLEAFPDALGQQGSLTGNEPSVKSGATTCLGKMSRGGHEFLKRNETELSAARFFYCAKASRADRNEGCDELPQNIGGMVSNTSGQHITRRDEAYEAYEAKPVGNNHPTVKPTELLQYLCRLITPPGGKVLDMFCGSGSTMKACVREGFSGIYIDMTPEYFEITKARVLHEQSKVDAIVPDPQMALFA